MSDTEAGRVLLNDVAGLIQEEWGDEEADLARRDYSKSIAAIEIEAMANERARIRAGVEGLGTDYGPGTSVEKAAVLALIDPEPVTLDDIERIGKTMGSGWEGVVSFDDAVKRLTAKTH